MSSVCTQAEEGRKGESESRDVTYYNAISKFQNFTTAKLSFLPHMSTNFGLHLAFA